MYIVVIGWAYVVLMMSISEESVVAGVMTFLLYGAVPITIIIYLSGARRRRERRAKTELQKRDAVKRGHGETAVSDESSGPEA